jgi:hypothetical protein
VGKSVKIISTRRKRSSSSSSRKRSLVGMMMMLLILLLAIGLIGLFHHDGVILWEKLRREPNGGRSDKCVSKSERDK